MFFNMWCEHNLFVGLIEAGWSISKLKRSLKDLNKKHYGHISAKAEAAKSELKQKQEELHKARNSKLFHSLAKRNFIAALTKEDGSTTSSLEEIQEKLIRFYGNLLGTKNEVQSFDATIMNEGSKVQLCRQISSGMDEYEKEAITDLTGFSEGTMPFCYLGVPLSGVYLKVADFAPLLHKVSNTLLTWASLNLSYTGRLEVISYVVQGIECFWLRVLPISPAMLDRITSMCRRFL
ncbi:hypothetical protein M9H77_17958 [Catharanthus roseus]|uniref:Uncharacterized protein n=1 Tax=Catharanthus roseus TaxID=4058 RepID=A0ACC0B625_CATRO|nr:hypothetical protein M9H77_17958 [Catharanthus roseus]